MRRSSSKRYPMCLVLVLVTLCSCAPVSTDRIVALSGDPHPRAFDKSLSIEEASSESVATGHDPGVISVEQFTDALETGLGRSNLFREVVRDGEADWRLVTHIVISTRESTGTVAGFYEETRVMVVDYGIYDVETGDQVWNQTINSRHASRNIGGYTRMLAASEGAAGLSIRQLIDALAAFNGG